LRKYDYKIAICNHIKSNYPNIYLETKALPRAFHGNAIAAIVLGADPSNEEGKRFKKVFGLENKESKYFVGIRNNIRKIGLSLTNVYIQNVVQNYFNVETSKNKYWHECALLWLEYLKKELDENFGREIPVIVTSWEILEALIGKEEIKKYTPNSIYSNSKFFSEAENYLGRNIFCLFRHPEYNLTEERWAQYWIDMSLNRNLYTNIYLYNEGVYKTFYNGKMKSIKEIQGH
jgi:hypothetical protein